MSLYQNPVQLMDYNNDISRLIESYTKSNYVFKRISKKRQCLSCSNDGCINCIIGVDIRKYNNEDREELLNILKTDSNIFEISIVEFKNSIFIPYTYKNSFVFNNILKNDIHFDNLIYIIRCNGGSNPKKFKDYAKYFNIMKTNHIEDDVSDVKEVKKFKKKEVGKKRTNSTCQYWAKSVRGSILSCLHGNKCIYLHCFTKKCKIADHNNSRCKFAHTEKEFMLVNF